jgi:hypothetical protein
MLLRNLFEDIGPVADAAFAFGRFNPAHQGHIEVYKAVQNAGRKWYIGTNPSTQGPNDPLSFEQKSAWMQAIYPAIHGHILPQQSVVTLASKLYEILGEGSTIAYVTDSKDWEWAGKLLNDYNGKEGPHGYYKFKAIKHVESPRVSSATALRTAARAGDEAAFYAASGTDPKLTVGGKTYFETVVDAVGAHPEKVKKVAKKKEPAATEGKKPEHNLGVGWMLDKDKKLGQKVAQNKARARQERQTMLKYAGKKDLGKEQGVAEVSKSTLDRYVTKAVDAHGHADFAARQSKDDPSKRSYHIDQKKTAEKRRQGIGRALDRMSKEGVAESEKQSKSREMDLDWHYKNIINTKGLSDKAKKDTTDIYNKLKKNKEQGVVEAGSNAMTDTAKRLSNKDDGKVAKLRAAGDKRREDQLKGRNIAKRNESVDLKTSLQELSNDMLGKYKKAASADASKADKEGNFKRGDKRFNGIVKATNKQFANDAKKTK